MPRRVSKENEELAEKIIDWSLANNHFDNSQIQELITDLNSKSNWNYWSSLSPNELLPKNESLRSKRMRNLYRKVIFMRNLLVFLPVTITWIAISEASSGFSELIADNEGSVVNFLQFWQDGYGYLNPIWRLSSVALIDFLILAFIMILTILLQLLSNQADKFENLDVAAKSQARQSLVREVYEFFSRNQKVTPLTFDRTMANALRDLSKSTSNLEKITKELGKSVKGFPAYLNVLQEVRTLNREVRKLRDKRE